MFRAQKRFFYNVLRSNVVVDIGSQIVSAHQGTLDGQRAWEALRVRFQDSPAAALLAREKLRTIQSTCYTASWPGTAEGFLTALVGMMTEHDAVVPPERRIKAHDRTFYLHQALAGDALLGAVHIQCEARVLGGNAPYTFDQVVGLYRTMCATIDHGRKRAGPSQGGGGGSGGGTIREVAKRARPSQGGRAACVGGTAREGKKRATPSQGNRSGTTPGGKKRARASPSGRGGTR